MKGMSAMRDDSCFPSLRTVHYLITEKTAKIVAHCLDLDVVAVGPDRETAVRRLNAVVIGQISLAIGSGNILLLNHKAPQEYWDRWNACPNVSKMTVTIQLQDPIPAKGEIGVVEAACAALA